MALHKVANPAWEQSGQALKGFWQCAVAGAATANPAIAFAWYHGFLQYLLDIQAYAWFAKLVASGELLIGFSLTLGAITGIAAFFRGLMNWNYMVAGTACQPAAIRGCRRPYPGLEGIRLNRRG